MRQTKIKHLDFKDRSFSFKDGRRPRFRRLHWLALGISGVAGVALMLSSHDQAEALTESPSGQLIAPLDLPKVGGERNSNNTAASLVAPVPLPKPAPKAAPAPTPAAPPATVAEAPPAAEDWQRTSVKNGDSLAMIFKRLGLDARTVHAVVNAGEAAKALTRIFPGDELEYRLDDAGGLAALRYRVDESVILHIDRNEDGYSSSLVATPLERRMTHAVATIDSSLFLAGKDAGLSDRLIMELAGIFGWDVDFALDIRAGDRFSVVYEELYRDGEKVRDGDIVAAEFFNRGRNFRAVLYTDPDGNRDYYSPDGRSMRKAFLRSPVDFRRISSNFNPNRLHPKLGVKRPHRGVDYAAATGTPIKAAGDGKIIFNGVKGGYGNTVIIQHGSRYSTLYAHLSRFEKGLKVGSRVRQGQTIGYVGSSGLATGPHLHYEFRVDGVHRNPVTVPLPEAEPISERLMADFLQQTAPLVAQLEVIGRTELAHNPEQP
mgnify:FL=1